MPEDKVAAYDDVFQLKDGRIVDTFGVLPDGIVDTFGVVPDDEEDPNKAEETVAEQTATLRSLNAAM